MSRDEAACIELVFSRGPSVSRRAKAKDLWTFLDSQSDLKPYVPPHVSTETDITKDSSSSTPEKSISLETITQDSRHYPWYEGLCILRHLGLDKIALAAKDSCSDLQRSRIVQNVTQEYGHLADVVEQPYDNINLELQAFEERVKKNDAVNIKRRMYEVPEKYERFC